MSLVNSFKVLCSNFSNMWKVLVYRLIVIIITLSIAIAVALPTLNYIYGLVDGTGVFKNIIEYIGAFFVGNLESSTVGERLSESFIAVGQILVDNLPKLFVTYIYLVLCMCLSRFLNCVADYALAYVINCRMESNSKVSFTSALFRNFGRGVKYALVKVMFTVPFDAGIILLAATLFVVLFAPLGFFMPLVVILIIIGIMSFRMTLFTGFLPALIIDRCKIFAGLKTGVKQSFSRFGSIYSSWVIIQLFAMVTIFALTLFTFGLGLIIIIPMIIMLYIIIYLVMYYNSGKKRYYIDHMSIVTPLQLYEEELKLSNEIKNHVYNDKD